MLQYNIDLDGKTILVTGAAGFIGSNLVKRLLKDFEEISVIGVDNLTDYYDVRLKQEALASNSSKVASPTRYSLKRFSRKTRLMWW